MPPARKRFGQHWLKSEAVLRQIVAAADLQPGDRLLEIGPGRGALTHHLLDAPVQVLAVEIDRDLVKQLVPRFGDRENFLLLEGDVLALDWDDLLADFPQFRDPRKVVANIPYNITGPLLEKLLGTIEQPRPHPFERLVLLMQREVGDRLTAAPGSKAYGSLSVKMQYLAECEQICIVPPKAFSPPPQVESVVVRLRPRPSPWVADHPKHLAMVLKVGFANRRKMLRNNLKSLHDLAYLHNLFLSLDINPEARAEELSLGDWVRLSNILSSKSPEGDGLTPD